MGSKEEREKEKAKRRHKEMVEEQRKIFEQLRKKKKLENGGDSDGDDSSGDEANFSIFDEPVFDENNPIYFSMYDKVKARRSCVKAKEEEEASLPTYWLICLEEGTGRLGRLRRYTGLRSERCIRKDQTGLQKKLSKRRKILTMLHQPRNKMKGG